MTPADPEVATAYHEAGHAVARFLTHGTTGPMIPAPLEGKEAGAEAEPLPGELLDGTKLVPGPYTPEQRECLIAEIRTTLAGCVAEGRIVGRSALDVLEDAASSSDRATVWGIAGRLWNSTDERDRRVDALRDEVEAAMAKHWSKVERVARAYLERGELTADEVRDLIGDD